MEPISAQRDADGLMLSKNKQNTKLYILVSLGSSLKEMSPKPRLQENLESCCGCSDSDGGGVPSPIETYVDAVTVLS